MKNIFSADNIYRAGRNLFSPRVVQREQDEMLKQMALTKQINQRQAPLRQALIAPKPVNVPAMPRQVSAPVAVAAARTTPFYSDISSTAKKHGINPKFLDALVFAESSYNPQAVSKSGAFGLTQLMPPTLKELGYTGDPKMLTPQQQLDYGAQYLKKIYDIRSKKLGKKLTPLEWYHSYSFGPNTSQPISPQYAANWERAYGRN